MKLIRFLFTHRAIAILLSGVVISLILWTFAFVVGGVDKDWASFFQFIVIAAPFVMGVVYFLHPKTIVINPNSNLLTKILLIGLRLILLVPVYFFWVGWLFLIWSLTGDGPTFTF